MFFRFNLCLNKSTQHSSCVLDNKLTHVILVPFLSPCCPKVSVFELVSLVSHYSLIINHLPLLRFWILVHGIFHNLINSLHRRLPCGNINDTLVYSRVKCYSGIPCTCGFIRGSWSSCHSIDVCRRHRCFPVMTLVGVNKHFWRRCRGRHRLKSY